MPLLYGKDLLIVCFGLLYKHYFFFFCCIIEIPKLLPMSEPDEGMGYDEDEPPSKTTKLKRSLKPSGPQAIDPYLDEQSSSFIPLLIAVAAAIPVIFCLCRL